MKLKEETGAHIDCEKVLIKKEEKKNDQNDNNMEMEQKFDKIFNKIQVEMDNLKTIQSDIIEFKNSMLRKKTKSLKNRDQEYQPQTSVNKVDKNTNSNDLLNSLQKLLNLKNSIENKKISEADIPIPENKNIRNSNNDNFPDQNILKEFLSKSQSQSPSPSPSQSRSQSENQNQMNMNQHFIQQDLNQNPTPTTTSAVIKKESPQISPLNKVSPPQLTQNKKQELNFSLSEIEKQIEMLKNLSIKN